MAKDAFGYGSTIYDDVPEDVWERVLYLRNAHKLHWHCIAVVIGEYHGIWYSAEHWRKTAIQRGALRIPRGVAFTTNKTGGNSHAE